MYKHVNGNGLLLFNKAAHQLRSLIGLCFSANAIVVLLSCLGFRGKEAIETLDAMVIYRTAYGAEILFSLVFFLNI